MEFTSKDVQEQLEIIKNTSTKRPPVEYTDEIKSFLNLVDINTITMEKGGFPYAVHIFKAKDATSKAPVFLSIHGGGWIVPHLDNDMYYSALMASKIQGIVVSPDYTTSEHAGIDVMGDECYEVLKYIKEHAAELGADTENITVGGYSAGGHLTACIVLRAMEEHSVKVKKQLLCYAPLCLMENIEEEPANKEKPEEQIRHGMAFEKLIVRGKVDFYGNPYNNPYAASYEQLAKMPETMVITAGKCPFRGEDEMYALRLAENGVKVIIKRYPEAHHGFIPHFYDEWEKAVELIADFVKA